MLDKPCMDNNRLIVVSSTRTDFDLALKLAFRHNSKCVGWSIFDPKKQRSKFEKDRPENLLGVSEGVCLVLHWYKGDSDTKVQTFPMEISSEFATNFAWEWLQSRDFGSEPDHDGSNHKGFIVFNDPWGHIAGDHSAFVAIGPAWAMAGK